MTVPKYNEQKVRALLPSPTPRSLGYRMPAEWMHHEGTWFSWPHNVDTWSGYLSEAESALAEAVYRLCQGEDVHINVLNESHQEHVAEVLEKAGATNRVFFHRFPTNDAWCRDHGAVFLKHREHAGRAAIKWGYNAWGGKYPPYDLDTAIPRQMAQEMDTPLFETPIILEGGSIEVNGAGLLMTTSTCLLNPNRNPGLSTGDIEYVLQEMLGVDEILWLEGELAGDDTDGHIDNLARFVDETTLVIPEAFDPKDENYPSLSSTIEYLKAWNKATGGRFEMVHVPMPDPYQLEGKRMPANYMNFYIGNTVVLLPAFGDQNDRIAQAILQSCFKNRDVILIDCRAIIWGLGAIHCLTQQVPSTPAEKR